MLKDLKVGEFLGVKKPGRSKKRPYTAETIRK